MILKLQLIHTVIQLSLHILLSKFGREKKSDSKDTDAEESSPKSESHSASSKADGKETKEKQIKELNEKQDKAKKEKSKETKKAGAKTAVASMLRAKKDMSNDLVGEKTTGDALKDGLSRLMQTFVEFINPMENIYQVGEVEHIDGWQEFWQRIC